MNEMDSQENKNIVHDPKAAAEAVLLTSKAALGRAMEIVYPDNPEADPLTVFAAPHERRDDDEGLNLSAEQESNLRAAAAELGFGRSTDRKASDLGLRDGHVAIIEGGQIHKVLAELGNALDDSSKPGSIVLGASPYRAINNPAERAISSRLLELDEAEVGETEYEVARQLLAKIDGFVEHAEPEVLAYGYDINDSYRISTEATGQFVKVGAINDTEVILLRIDREDYIDDEGKAKYRNQPDSAAVMKIVSDILSEGSNDSDVAFHTSSTYQASRDVDAARASIQTRRRVAVPTYGVERLAEVKGEEMPAPGPINQLPGELHKMAQQVQKLEQLLSEG